MGRLLDEGKGELKAQEEVDDSHIELINNESLSDKITKLVTIEDKERNWQKSKLLLFTPPPQSFRDAKDCNDSPKVNQTNRKLLDKAEHQLEVDIKIEDLDNFP